MEQLAFDCVLPHRVVQYDCVEAMRSLAGSGCLFDLVIADPPYNIGVDYGDGKAADRRPDYDSWSREWIEAAAAVVAPHGSLWVISGQEHAAVIDLAIQGAGLSMRNRITWEETFGVYCHNKFGRTSRPVFYAVKDPSNFTFNADVVRVPSARQERYGDKRADPRGKIMGDVWRINRVCGTFRERVAGVPTQLPVELVSRIVSCCSRQGDTILDPFAGSGTTILAAMMAGRVGHGIEKSLEYTRIANERLARAAKGLSSRDR